MNPFTYSPVSGPVLGIGSIAMAKTHKECSHNTGTFSMGGNRHQTKREHEITKRKQYDANEKGDVVESELGAGLHHVLRDV